MTPEEWKKLNALFHEALELPEEARAAHLTKACAAMKDCVDPGMDSLRSEQRFAALIQRVGLPQ